MKLNSGTFIYFGTNLESITYLQIIFCDNRYQEFQYPALKLLLKYSIRKTKAFNINFIIPSFKVRLQPV